MARKVKSALQRARDALSRAIGSGNRRKAASTALTLRTELTKAFRRARTDAGELKITRERRLLDQFQRGLDWSWTSEEQFNVDPRIKSALKRLPDPAPDEMGFERFPGHVMKAHPKRYLMDSNAGWDESAYKRAGLPVEDIKGFHVTSAYGRETWIKLDAPLTNWSDLWAIVRAYYARKSLAVPFWGSK